MLQIYINLYYTEKKTYIKNIFFPRSLPESVVSV